MIIRSAVLMLSLSQTVHAANLMFQTKSDKPAAPKVVTKPDDSTAKPKVSTPLESEKTSSNKVQTARAERQPAAKASRTCSGDTSVLSKIAGGWGSGGRGFSLGASGAALSVTLNQLPKNDIRKLAKAAEIPEEQAQQLVAGGVIQFSGSVCNNDGTLTVPLAGIGPATGKTGSVKITPQGSNKLMVSGSIGGTSVSGTYTRR